MLDKTRFRVNNILDAKAIILTPHEGKLVCERWEHETPFTMKKIVSFIKITESMTILDYGCGIGRIAKELIQKYNCRVIGVDSSPDMRRLATQYCNSEKFECYSVEEFSEMSDTKIDFAYSIWVLQHILDVENAINLIRQSLQGKLMVINTFGRLIPCKDGWYSDHVDIQQLLNQNFKFCQTLEFDDSFFSKWYRYYAFIHVYETDRK